MQQLTGTKLGHYTYIVKTKAHSDAISILMKGERVKGCIGDGLSWAGGTLGAGSQSRAPPTGRQPGWQLRLGAAAALLEDPGETRPRTLCSHVSVSSGTQLCTSS